MRKLKLFLATLAMIVGGVNCAWADVDYTASFANANANWTGNDGAEKNTTPSAGGVTMSECYYKAYGTGFAMKQTAYVPNGYYDVEVYAQAHHAWLADFDASTMTNVNTLYVNSSSQKVPTVDNTGFTSDEPTLYTFTNVAVTDGTLTINFNRDANGANWFTMNVKSVTLKTTATDATSYITNPDFSGSTWSEGWTGTGSNKANAFVSQTNGSFTGVFAEMWVQNSTSMDAADLNQTITLPAGIYTLTAKVQAGIDCELYASISGNEQIHTCNGSISSQSLTFYVDADNTSVKIGLRHNGIISPSNSVWVAVDQFRLMRHGDTNNADLTDKVINWNFQGSDGWTKTTPNGGNSGNYGTTAVEYWISTAANGSFDYYQDLSGLPNGKYNLSASMWNTSSANGSGTAASGECGVYGTSSFNTDFAGVTSDSNGANLATYATTNGVVVTDGTLRVGVKNNETMKAQWFGVDWIKLNYTGLAIVNEAVEFTSGNETIADTWYYYDLPTNENYEFTSSNAATLTYTADGTQLLSGATGTESEFTAEETKTISLSAGRLYFKTSATTTLTVSYKYSVSKATADLNYIQKDNIVTVSFAVSSNEPGVTLSQDYSGVTFEGNAISVTPTASGFTFTVPTVTAATDYTLTIPARAIGYASGNTYNEAQDIKLSTPAIFDGTYFLKVAATFDGTSEGESAAVGKYLARGTAYSTHVSLDSYGLPVTLTTNGDNVTNLKMADTNAYIFSPSNSNYDIYADGAATEPNIGYTVCMKEDKYLIASNFRSTSETKKYFKYNTSAVNQEEISVFDDGTGTNDGPIILWTIESIADHATAMQDRKNAQAEAAAVAAYESGNYDTLKDITTVSELESTLSSGYIEGVFVSPSEISSVEESYQPRNNNVNNIVPVTVYSNTIEITQAGFYKFSMQAFNRATWNANVQALHNVGADMPAAVLFFGDSETQIKSLYDEEGHDTAVEGADPADAQYNGKYYANCKPSALKMFKDDKYHNDVWFYCSTPGTYTYGVKVMGYAAGQWFIYSPESVTITSYAVAAADDDYTALQAAINAYDDANWGFEEGECAPYNNVAAIKNIAAAKAIDKNAENSKLLVNSLATALTLKVNTEEVNAVNNITDGVAYNTAGWTRTQTWNNWRDPYYSVPTGTMTYGEVLGYTMPLKANTVYQLTFDHQKWDDNNADNGGKISVLNTNGAGLPETSYEGTVDSKTENFLFRTGEAGDYVFSIVCESGRLTFANVVIKKAVIEDVTMDEDKAYTPANTYANVTLKRKFTADVWNTFCVPFDIDNTTLKAQFGDEVAVSTAALTAEAVTFKPMTTPAITANTPVIIKVPNASTSEFTFNDVMIKTGDAKVTGEGVNFVGNYAGKFMLTAGDYYIAQNKLKKATGTQYVNGFRAYFDNTASTARFGMFFDGEDTTTGIDGVEVAPLMEGNVYNLNGQRVDKAQKGLYIVNGKKVVVK